MITILISHERSGSHLLGDLIGSLSGVDMTGEVCNAVATPPAESAESYHRFRYEWISRNPENALEPSRSRQFEMINAYFEHLVKLKNNRNVVVDIKYGHIHNFESYWCSLFGKPLLFDVCEKFHIQLLHLHRRNVVEAAVSDYIAVKSNLWQVLEQDVDVEGKRRHFIPPGAIIANALLLREQTRWVKEKLTQRLKHFDFTYEQLVASIKHDNRDLDKLADFIGAAKQSTFKPRRRKLGRPLKEQIENYAEFAGACVTAGLGEHLEASD